ncbi:hypothetical protein [Alkalihalobacillus sp. AL-G]|uniref:hypothetical protein n=1 Tax=Alkalihalobacillus sp. AL-G TaxID=2926399 RepID=UPI00272D3270|nr:hypothetical protein [Alkalihalobacillus sp. AL-G]WLD92756.1 hypothetical protein MOJ78_17360 [Alkalihalobacillus sp. AL-G]
MKMRQVIWVTLISALILVGSNHIVFAEEGIEVENLPSIFDDGTHIPDHIELKTWEETKSIIPKGSEFEVIDIETGLFFKVQRRAGSKHADVQPLTKTDTAIMKAIYNGKWSWKRRAIYIMKDGHVIAASMHGMPHGAGALVNNFPGHFCIHLPGSTTHTSRKEDPTHQLMILKAAGKLDHYIEKANSEQLADVFMNAVNQEDHSIVRKTIEKRLSDEKLKQVFFIHPAKPISEDAPTNILMTQYPVKVMYKTDQGLMKKKLNLTVQRYSLTGRWYVNIDKLLKSLPGEDEA